MTEIIKCLLSCGKVFSIGNNRTKLLQWTVVLFLMLITYIFIYHNAGFNIKSYFYKYVWKNSHQLTINEFRRYLYDSSLNDISLNNSLCPIIPPDLVGDVKINTDILSYESIEKRNKELQPGGCYSPTVCSPRHHVAILIPYRDRLSHLKLFLQNIHPFLRNQQLDYGVYVIELASGIKFNRAMLFNIGFNESLKISNYGCFIFHDVDLLPENDLNLYCCSEKPRHMSVAIDKMKYKLPYNQIFGGVSAMTKEQFEKVNGFSNLYFGWGGEDDDMYNRIVHSKMNIIRYSAEVARYKMLSHAKDTPNPVRGKLLKHGAERFQTDGLNSLKYNVLKIEKRKLYTWILVSVDDTVPVPEFEEESIFSVWFTSMLLCVILVSVLLFMFFLKNRNCNCNKDNYCRTINVLKRLYVCD